MVKASFKYPFLFQFLDYALGQKVMKCLFCFHFLVVQLFNLFHDFFGKYLCRDISLKWSHFNLGQQNTLP